MHGPGGLCVLREQAAAWLAALLIMPQVNGASDSLRAALSAY